jgi:hypothetical protein
MTIQSFGFVTVSRVHFTPDKEGDSEKPTLLTGGLG